ncbi:hypothetical protein ID866_9395 [Astraeus odoratus]|nr:hypothetical protein ID866_9395 [Astraeus odoratus]
MYEKYYSDEALHSKLGNLSIEQQAKLKKSTAEKEAKAEKKADAPLKKKMASQVSIQRIKRNKRKRPPPSDVDLKKAAKFLAQKYATGVSGTKNVQGDVQELVQNGNGVFAGVPAANVEIVEEKKRGEE